MTFRMQKRPSVYREAMQAYRPLMDSSSFQISLPVLVMSRSRGTEEGLSVTMNQVPLNR